MESYTIQHSSERQITGSGCITWKRYQGQRKIKARSSQDALRKFHNFAQNNLSAYIVLDVIKLSKSIN